MAAVDRPLTKEEKLVRLGSTRFVPYCEISLVQGQALPASEIWIGPNAHPREACDGVYIAMAALNRASTDGVQIRWGPVKNSSISLQQL